MTHPYEETPLGFFDAIDHAKATIEHIAALYPEGVLRPEYADGILNLWYERVSHVGGCDIHLSVAISVCERRDKG